jgi:hypothetical protein
MYGVSRAAIICSLVRNPGRGARPGARRSADGCASRTPAAPPDGPATPPVISIPASAAVFPAATVGICASAAPWGGVVGETGWSTPCVSLKQELCHNPSAAVPRQGPARPASRRRSRAGEGAGCTGVPTAAAPKGERNGNYKHGRYTAETIATRRWLREAVSMLRVLNERTG